MEAPRTFPQRYADEVVRLSNCCVQAWRLMRMIRRMRREGGLTGPGWEVYGWWRESRARNGVIHVGVGILDKATDQLRMISWKPKAPVDVPWWQAWRRLAFEGEWREGDFPDTAPMVKRP